MQKKLLEYLKIIRPVNLTIIVITQLLIRYCVIEVYYGFSLTPLSMALFDFVLLMLSTVLIAAGGYVINDMFDLPVDETNKPSKIIAGKYIPIEKLKTYYFILTILGNLIGIYLSFKVNYLWLGLVFPVVSIMLWYYSSRYQKTILAGNVMIASLSALVVLIVWLFEFFAIRDDVINFVNILKQVNYIHVIVFGYSLFAFFVSLSREVAKDVEDIEGDREGKFKTFPIIYGKKASKNLLMIIHVFTMLLLGVFQYLLYIQDLMLVFWYLAIAVQLLFVFVLYYVVTAEQKKDFHFLSNAYKLIMVAGILSMQLIYISF